MPFPLDDQEYYREHFRNKGISWTDEGLAGVLQDPQSSRWDVCYAVLGLRDCGTLRSVDALKSVLHYPMQDVKCAAVLTIAHIARESETPLYASLLLDPTYREKGYALWALRDAGDERGIDAVLQYFKRSRSKLRRGKLATGTIPEGLAYLQKFVDQDARVVEFFGEVLLLLPDLYEREAMLEHERREIRQIPFFREHWA